jgi:hypothetical protein
MAMQTKQKSKGDRTSQARRATDSELGRTAVTPALLPESAARSRQFKPEELGAADEWLATNSDDQTVKLKMFKRGDKTYVTLVGDVQSLMRDLGTKDLDFLSGLVDQVANASPKASSYLEDIGLDSWGTKQFVDELGIQHMLAFIKESKPRDPIEATLLSQMAATNAAVMSFANRLANAKSLAERDSAERTFNKLMRTFAAQVEALQRYRSKSENKVFFQHVSVNDSAQAIVGDVTRPARKRASRKRTRASPLIPDARQRPMDIISEPQRARVPLRRK